MTDEGMGCDAGIERLLNAETMVRAANLDPRIRYESRLYLKTHGIRTFKDFDIMVKKQMLNWRQDGKRPLGEFVEALRIQARNDKNLENWINATLEYPLKQKKEGAESSDL